MQSRILVVEDDHLQQSLLKVALTTGGHEVESCSDRLDAIRRIPESRFDLVLLDYRLAEIDSLATARLIHDLMGEAARPRLVALTATPGRVVGHEMLTRHVFDGIIAKSPNLPALVATVGRYLHSPPDRTERQTADLDLLVKDWSEFEAPPK